MTNYEALYNQAMAHNAMLRETILELHSSLDFCDIQIEWKITKALNATGDDAEAWERKLREQVMLAVQPLQPEYEKLKKQLETIKTELETFKNDINNLLNGLL